ncbi:MAG TPA: helix-turn-helix transcriptional regulator [Longimicrobiales bacterium]|jgi:DNA-binding PadR family transcriptional regulator
MSRNVGEFEQLLLFAILRLEKDAYGVTIRREIEERTGRAVSAGAVYTGLERLEAKALVASDVGGAEPARGGRRKRYYRLEPEGAAALQAAYREVQVMAEGVAGKLASMAVGAAFGE